jgi:hypothetical protein
VAVGSDCYEARLRHARPELGRHPDRHRRRAVEQRHLVPLQRVLTAPIQRAVPLALVAVLVGCAVAQEPSTTAATQAQSTTTAIPAETTTTSSAPYVQPEPGEGASVFLACVEAHGFTAELQPDGSVLVQSAPEQFEVFRQVMDECRRESLGLTGTVPPPTAEQVEQFYEDLIELSVCLEGQGYDISEPPSLDAFIEGGVGSWDPIGEVLAIHDLSPSRLNQLNAVCPQPQLYSATDG